MDLTDVPDAVDTTDADPPDFSEWDDPEAALKGGSTRERMLDVIVQLREPQKVSTVAERADCDPETARDYLQWFAELGMVREITGRPVLYVRNDRYFEWRRIERIRAELSTTEIVAELTETIEQLSTYREQFDADSPDEVSLRETDAESIEARWEALSKWQTLERRAELLDAARSQTGSVRGVETADG